MVTEQLDATKAEAFAGQVVGILNGAMLSLMLGEYLVRRGKEVERLLERRANDEAARRRPEGR